MGLTVGQRLKAKRIQMGLPIKHFVDELLSQPTISRIENDYPFISFEKKKLYASKLGIELDENDEIPMSDAEILLELELLENDIDSNLDIAHEKLQALTVPSNHALYPYIRYLEGKVLYRKNQIELAKQCFLDSWKTSPERDHRNIKSAALCELGRIEYYSNLPKALEFIEKGLESFVPDGQRKYVRYALALNKAIFLEKMRRYWESVDVIDFLWNHVHEIESLEVKLQVYELKAIILKQRGKYDEAIRYIIDAIWISQINKCQFDRRVELFTLLGNIYIVQEKLRKAEKVLLSALDLTEKVSNRSLLISTYIALGELYLRKKDKYLAEEYLQEAVKLGEETNNPIRYVQSLIAISKFYIDRKQRKAMELLNKALDLSRKHGLIAEEYDALYHLAKCYKKKNRNKFLSCLEEMFSLEQKMKQNKIEIPI